MSAASGEVRPGGPPATTARGGRADAALLVLTVAAVLGMLVAFVASMLYFTEGHLSPPLDDTLIYFQYARQAAHGQPFVYFDGDPPTSGATSVAYPFLLAAGYAGGFREQYLAVFGLGLATVFLATAALLTRAVAASFMDARAAWLAALLVAVNGWLGWTFFAMMESGLHAVTLLAALALFIPARTSARARWLLAATLCFAPFVRPEFALLGPGIGLYWLLAALWRPAPMSGAQRTAPLLAAIAGAALFFALMLALTGSVRPATFVAQSVLSRGYLDWPTKIDMILDAFWWHVRYAFTFFAPSYAALIAGGLAAAGAALLVADDVRDRRPTLRSLVPLLFVAGLLGASVRDFAQIHHHRWAAPYEPLAVLLVVRGAVGAMAFISARETVRVAAALLLLAGSLFGAARMAHRYGRNASDIYFQQTQAAFWIRDNTPPGTVVAFNDAGALSYFGRRRGYDMVGLVSRDAAADWAAGRASSYEGIERLSPEDWPTLYAIYVYGMAIAEPHFGFLTPVTSFELDEKTIAGSARKDILRPDNTLLRSGDAPVQTPPGAEGWSVADRLDVADLHSEDAHRYRSAQVVANQPPVQELWTRTYIPGGRRVADGGRVNVRETFTLDTREGRPYVVLLRASQEHPLRISVRADGRETTIDESLAPGAWRDIVVARGDSAPQELEVEVQAVDGAYSSFSYWLLQPE